MHALPVVSISKDFTTTGTWDPFVMADGVTLMPLVHPVSKWEMQVTGLTTAGVFSTLTSWTVDLLASLDGIVFPATSVILEHKNGTNANGDVVWPTVSSISPFRDAKFIRVSVASLTLNAANKIRVTVRGF